MKKYKLCFLTVLWALLGLSAAGAYAENVDTATLVIDTESSCVTNECHDSMGKKKFVHGVGVNGKNCIKCHMVEEKGAHRFGLPPTAIELCAQCHSGEYIAPSDIEGTPPKIIASTDVFEEGEKTGLHKPFKEGKCTECHDAHESDYYLHLKASYPEFLYARFSLDSYGLCLKCHEGFGKVLKEPRTLTGTMFRNGNLNLHFRHVNKEKGRSCKACHHPHGSENPGLIRDTFLFGLRKLSVNFEKTETGGGCGPSCHIPLKYDRYDPTEVIMKTTPRLGEDASWDELNESRQRDMEKAGVENERTEADTNEIGERSKQ